jgi:STAS-like domain of unknown function (DUF4325)
MLIGQAFADEIFRVFHDAHPDIRLEVVNAEPDVTKMIERALRESTSWKAPEIASGNQMP